MIELLEIKGFRKITIRDIAEKARINRGTFYKHYQNKYQLIESVFEETIQSIIEISSFFKAKNTDVEAIQTAFSQIPFPLVELFDYFRKNSRIYCVMLNSDESALFQRKLRTFLADLLSMQWSKWKEIQKEESFKLEEPIPTDLSVELCSAILFETITWWIESEMKYSSKQMAVWTRRFITVGTIGHMPPMGP